MKRGYKKVWLVADLVLIVLLIILDQVTKLWASNTLKGKSDIILIEGWLQLHYLENRGAAFGMLQNQKFFFIFVVIVVLSIIIYVLYRIPDRSKYMPIHFFSAILTSGAIGNMIDRLRLDYVVDFIYFSKIDFPVFNVADICVTVSTFFLMFLIMFRYKEDDFKFLGMNPKTRRDM